MELITKPVLNGFCSRCSSLSTSLHTGGRVCLHTFLLARSFSSSVCNTASFRPRGHDWEIHWQLWPRPFHVTSSFCVVFKIISLPLPSENLITVYLAVSYRVLLVGKLVSIPTFRPLPLVKCTFCSSSPSFSNYVLFGLLGDILYLLWLSSLFFFIIFFSFEFSSRPLCLGRTLLMLCSNFSTQWLCLTTSQFLFAHFKCFLSLLITHPASLSPAPWTSLSHLPGIIC